MSADNGIYILPVLYKSESTTFDAEGWIRWRVIEAGAIDNITFAPDREDGYNAEQLEHYFGDAREFECEHEAILYAHEKAKEYTVLEYGVSTLPQTDYKFAKKHKSVKPSPRTYQFDGGVDESTLFLVNGNGHNNIVTVSRLTPDQTVEPVSDEQWQKIIDIIVLAPQFIELAKEMNLALSDIINAADNKQPYNAKELEDNFMPYCGKMHELLKELGEERK